MTTEALHMGKFYWNGADVTTHVSLWWAVFPRERSRVPVWPAMRSGGMSGGPFWTAPSHIESRLAHGQEISIFSSIKIYEEILSAENVKPFSEVMISSF